MRRHSVKEAAPAPSYAELVAEWAAGAHSVTASDRASILRREVEALENSNRSRPGLITRLRKQQEKLEGCSMSETQCFEMLAARMQAASGAVNEDTLDPLVELHVAVRNRFLRVQGASAVAEELASESRQLGPTCGTSTMWCQDKESVFVLMRQHSLGFDDADTKVVDTVTFNESTFNVSRIDRLILPSHSGDRRRHIRLLDGSYTCD